MEKWSMPKWMKKYIKFISKGFGEKRSITKIMNDRQIYFREDPINYVTCRKVKAQVDLLEKLYKEGIIK